MLLLSTAALIPLTRETIPLNIVDVHYTAAFTADALIAVSILLLSVS